MFRLTIGIFTIAGALGRECQDLCDSVTGCSSSNCNLWQNPPVCMGLFYNGSGQMCAQGTEGCNTALPVSCPIATNTCNVVCASTHGCLDKGSYCKSWQTVPVCFGLYYTDESKSSTCFHRGGPEDTCPQLWPVGCEDDEVITTTVSPVVDVAEPTGQYSGETTRSSARIVLDANFHATKHLLDVTFTIHAEEAPEPMVVPVGDIAYSVDGDKVIVQDGPGIQTLMMLYPKLKLEDIKITYKRATDEIEARFGRLATISIKKRSGSSLMQQSNGLRGFSASSVARTTVKPAVTLAAPLPGPYGKYAGDAQTMIGKVGVAATFNAQRQVLDVAFTVGGKVVEGKDLVYTMDGNKVVLKDCPGIQALLQAFPLFKLEDIKISYNPSKDEVDAAFGKYLTVTIKKA